MLSVSLLGGLGVLPSVQVPNLPTPTINITDPNAPAQPLPGECRTGASGQPEFIWVAAAGSVPGHWERIRAGQSCAIVNATGGAIDTRDHRGEDGVAQGGVTVSPTRVMQIGPFTIPVVRAGRAYTWGLDDYSKLSNEAATAISTQLQQKIDYPGRGNWIDVASKNAIQQHNWAQDPSPGKTTTRLSEQTGEIGEQSVWPAAAPWGGPWLTQAGWMRKLGVGGSGGAAYESRYFGFDTNYASPIMAFDHPDSGDTYGVFMQMVPVGPTIYALHTILGPNGRTDGYVPDPNYLESLQSMQLQFLVKPIDTGGFFDWIMKYVLKVVAAYIDGIVAAAEGISDALCAITATPGALTSAAAAGGPYAAGAAAATEFAMQGKCPIPNPGPSGESKGDGDIPAKAFPWGPVLAGGVAVLGVIAFVMSSSKKKPAPRKLTA